ncbi:unnamed protein product [Closterium sp. NIES-65]|nr:unnamed protein product [Closterium sp. NIES-65]CAI5985759.1 unnamed protein product [Closterium sp. NIES-65]
MRPVRTILIGALLLVCLHVAYAGFPGFGGKKKKACDLSVGSWAPSTKYPVYDSSCPYISQEFNCEKNGRPDGDFRHFEWKPSGCKLVRFDAKKFAMTFVGQAVAIVGDNSGLYMYQSLRCRLEAANFKTESFNPSTIGWTGDGFKVKPWGVKVVFVHAPFLTEADPMDPESSNRTYYSKGRAIASQPSGIAALNIVLRNIADYIKSNVMLESSNRTYYSKGRAIASQPSGIAALNIVLRNIADYIKSNVMLVQPYALSIPPAHMPNMFQYADTTCALFAGPLSSTATDLAKARSSVVAWTNAQINALSKSRVKLLNILSLSLYRADAHVGTYRPAGGSTEMDCAKWCLPGVPDVWLDLWYHQVSDPFNLKP